MPFTTLLVHRRCAGLQVSEEQLRQAFMRCGEVVYCKIPPGKGCGFVQFMERRCAEYAIQASGLGGGRESVQGFRG